MKSQLLRYLAALAVLLMAAPVLGDAAASSTTADSREKMRQEMERLTVESEKTPGVSGTDSIAGALGSIKISNVSIGGLAEFSFSTKTYGVGESDALIIIDFGMELQGDKSFEAEVTSRRFYTPEEWEEIAAGLKEKGNQKVKEGRQAYKEAQEAMADARARYDAAGAGTPANEQAKKDFQAAEVKAVNANIQVSEGAKDLRTADAVQKATYKVGLQSDGTYQDIIAGVVQSVLAPRTLDPDNTFSRQVRGKDIDASDMASNAVRREVVKAGYYTWTEGQKKAGADRDFTAPSQEKYASTIQSLEKVDWVAAMTGASVEEVKAVLQNVQNFKDGKFAGVYADESYDPATGQPRGGERPQKFKDGEFVDAGPAASSGAAVGITAGGPKVPEGAKNFSLSDLADRVGGAFKEGLAKFEKTIKDIVTGIGMDREMDREAGDMGGALDAKQGAGNIGFGKGASRGDATEGAGGMAGSAGNGGTAGTDQSVGADYGQKWSDSPYHRGAGTGTYGGGGMADSTGSVGGGDGGGDAGSSGSGGALGDAGQAAAGASGSGAGAAGAQGGEGGGAPSGTQAGSVDGGQGAGSGTSPYGGKGQEGNVDGGGMDGVVNNPDGTTTTTHQWGETGKDGITRTNTVSVTTDQNDDVIGVTGSQTTHDQPVDFKDGTSDTCDVTESQDPNSGGQSGTGVTSGCGNPANDGKKVDTSKQNQGGSGGAGDGSGGSDGSADTAATDASGNAGGSGVTTDTTASNSGEGEKEEGGAEDSGGESQQQDTADAGATGEDGQAQADASDSTDDGEGDKDPDENARGESDYSMGGYGSYGDNDGGGLPFAQREGMLKEGLKAGGVDTVGSTPVDDEGGGLDPNAGGGIIGGIGSALKDALQGLWRAIVGFIPVDDEGGGVVGPNTNLGAGAVGLTPGGEGDDDGSVPGVAPNTGQKTQGQTQQQQAQ